MFGGFPLTFMLHLLRFGPNRTPQKHLDVYMVRAPGCLASSHQRFYKDNKQRDMSWWRATEPALFWKQKRKGDICYLVGMSHHPKHVWFFTKKDHVCPESPVDQTTWLVFLDDAWVARIPDPTHTKVWGRLWTCLGWSISEFEIYIKSTCFFSARQHV